MTWGEIQLESLKKMFLNKDILINSDLDNYKKDKKYKTYLDAMPQACNEAINYIIEKEPIIKIYKLDKVSETSTYDLKQLISDYKKFYDLDSDTFVNWKLITKNLLKIDGWSSGNINVLYSCYPSLITSSTESDYKLEFEESFSRIIPLYIAGELYKDDDLTLSTIYMNEFITNLNNLLSNDNFVNNKIQSVYRMEI